MPNICVAQRTAISLDKMNILYIGVPNPITIALENYKPSQFKVYINNGTIEKSESKLDNQFVVMPKERGKATIYIIINKKDTISKYEYRVKPIGLPIISSGVTNIICSCEFHCYSPLLSF